MAKCGEKSVRQATGAQGEAAAWRQAARSERLKQVDIGDRRVDPVGTERHRVDIA